MEDDIRFGNPQDCEAMAVLYNHHVRETMITFEDERISAEEMHVPLNDWQERD